jgi:hypothetical protein
MLTLPASVLVTLTVSAEMRQIAASSTASAYEYVKHSKTTWVIGK